VTPTVNLIALGGEVARGKSSKTSLIYLMDLMARAEAKAA
jgi:hypothetical protein